MEHLTDKELIRKGRYFEALGENYNSHPIYVMLFEGTKKYIKVPTISDDGCRYNKQVIVPNDSLEGDWFGVCISHLKGKDGKDINFSDIDAAKRWIKKNTKPLPDNQWWCFGNHNADWL